MDPLFHYLNRIPQVLSVQACVDDTTIVGDAQDARWIQQVANCYADVRSAGFVVDSHSCYRGATNSVMKVGPSKISSAQLLRKWPTLFSGLAYATGTAALQATLKRGCNSLIVRFSKWPVTPIRPVGENAEHCHIAINFNFEQGHEIVHGHNTHTLGAFSAITCGCT